jgi:D-alanyl-D-alanine carboxypeptidase (penicillin-binding protein 5/6)
MPAQTNLTYRDALYGLMLPSGCDAANLLAFNVGKGERDERIPDFIRMMNEKAKEIGTKNTNFGNAHGLFHADTYSTAHDMFLITKYVLTGRHANFFQQLVGTIEYSMPPNSQEPTGYNITNSNLLLIRPDGGNPYYYDFVLGGKTGGLPYYYTRVDGEWVRSGNNLANHISFARQNEFTYIIVTMHAPWHFDRVGSERPLHHAFNDHINLYRWAFSTFERTRVMQSNEPIRSVRVVDGDKDELLLYPLISDDFWALLPRTLDLESAVQRIITIPEPEIEAPVEQGEIFGTIELRLNNVSLGWWHLITNESTSRSRDAEIRDTIGSVFGSWWFIPLLVLLGILVITLIVLSYVRKHRKAQKERFGRINRGRKPNRRIRR